MSDIENAVARIKALECPTGEIENRIRGVLTDYQIANQNEISICKDHRFDRHGAQRYSAKFSGDNHLGIVVLAVSGMDDYVTKVIDAYISE